MSSSVSFNGATYTLPTAGDTGWGANVTAFLTAVANNALAKSGGSFTLTAEADFGATYGLKAAYFKSQTANAASAGVLRLARADAVKWRNEANGADLTLGVDSSNNLEWEGADVVTVSGTQTLTNKTINGATMSGTIAGTPNFTGPPTVSGLAVVTTSGTQTLTNKTLSTGCGVIAQYSRSTAQTLTNNVDTLVDFPNLIIDTASAVTTGASWKFTAPATGYYRVHALVSISGNITVDFRVNIYKNGSGAGAMSIDNQLQASNSAYGGSRIIHLTAGDYIDIRAYQSSGADRQTIADANFNYVSIDKIPG
jgi:hypothetical protein